MARPAGFEPTTPWFVARYSIQLSYGRKARIIAGISGQRSGIRHQNRCHCERSLATGEERMCPSARSEAAESKLQTLSPLKEGETSIIFVVFAFFAFFAIHRFSLRLIFFQESGG